MAKYQTRKVVLKKRLEKVELENGQGHIWQRGPNPGTTGFPLYNAKEERELFEALLKKHRAAGYKVVSDSGLSAEVKARRPAGMSAKTWRWGQDANQVLEMWRDGDYDNHKDAIFDARDLLEKAPSDQAARVTRLNRMVTKATSELRREAERDPKIAEYARGIIDLPVKRKRGTGRGSRKSRTPRRPKR